jgi:homoserine kinase
VSSNIPVARGLGSSAAAVVAGAVAATRSADSRSPTRSCSEVCADVEGHPDNVAAAIHGGFVLVVPGSPARWCR